MSITLHIYSGASKHFISDVDLHTEWDHGAMNVTFNTVAGITITSRAVGTVKFNAVDVEGGQRILA